MMPLTMLGTGREAVINNCGKRDKTRRYLEGLGIVPGAGILVLSEVHGSLIVSVRGTRIALSRGIAQKVMVNA